MNGEDGFRSDISDWPCNMPYARGDSRRRDDDYGPDPDPVQGDDYGPTVKPGRPITKETKQQYSGFLTDKQKRRRFRR